MEKDLPLIERIQETRDEKSLRELIEMHSGIYIDMVNKYMPDSIGEENKEDILSDKDFCIYDAALRFKTNKNTKFSTYLGNLTKWKCQNIFTKYSKFGYHSLDDEPQNEISIDFDIVGIEQEEALARVYAAIEHIEDERARKIFRLRYQSSKSKLTPWKKIAKELDMSIQGCINIHNKSIKEIRNHV